MPQRTYYTVVPTIVADDVNWDDDYEVDLEGNASLLVFTVRGASTAFLVTAPASALSAQNMVVGEITPIADATTDELVDPINCLTDDAGIDDQSTTVEFDVDGGVYELFQDLALPFRVLIETEQMLVTAVVDGATEDTWTVIRGINGTTVAAHATDVAVLHLIGPETDRFRIDDAANVEVNDVIKIATGGTERMLITAKSEVNEVIVVKRGIWGTTPAAIANNANIWAVMDDVKIKAAIAAANSDLRVLDQPNKWPEGDVTDNRVPLRASDFS